MNQLNKANKEEDKTIGAENETQQVQSMRNSEKRKVKRSFPRPKASAILGLEQEGPLSMHNTISTNNPKRVELLMENGKDVSNLISSIENSSVE